MHSHYTPPGWEQREEWGLAHANTLGLWTRPYPAPAPWHGLHAALITVWQFQLSGLFTLYLEAGVRSWLLSFQPPNYVQACSWLWLTLHQH